MFIWWLKIKWKTLVVFVFDNWSWHFHWHHKCNPHLYIVVVVVVGSNKLSSVAVVGSGMEDHQVAQLPPTQVLPTQVLPTQFLPTWVPVQVLPAVRVTLLVVFSMVCLPFQPLPVHHLPTVSFGLKLFRFHERRSGSAESDGSSALRDAPLQHNWAIYRQ